MQILEVPQLQIDFVYTARQGLEEALHAAHVEVTTIEVPPRDLNGLAGEKVAIYCTAQYIAVFPSPLDQHPFRVIRILDRHARASLYLKGPFFFM